MSPRRKTTFTGKVSKVTPRRKTMLRGKVSKPKFHVGGISGRVGSQANASDNIFIVVEKSSACVATKALKNMSNLNLSEKYSDYIK